MSASRTKSKKMRQKTHRYTSNVFSMFSQDQIQEFKEAFNMIDQNRDGFVDKEDLIEMMTSLGKNPDDDFLDHMIAEAPGPINFTMFLTLFGEKLNGTDPEDVIKNAFECFDHKQFGFINEERLREVMTSMGDRWSDEMVDELFHTSPINQGNFDYIEFIRTLKHGHKDKDEEKLKSSPAPKSPVSKTAPALPSTPAPAAAAAAPTATASPATPKSALKKVAPPEGTKTPGAADAKPGKPTLKKAFGAPGRLNSPLLKK